MVVIDFNRGIWTYYYTRKLKFFDKKCLQIIMCKLKIYLGISFMNPFTNLKIEIGNFKGIHLNVSATLIGSCTKKIYWQESFCKIISGIETDSNWDEKNIW